MANIPAGDTASLNGALNAGDAPNQIPRSTTSRSRSYEDATTTIVTGTLEGTSAALATPGLQTRAGGTINLNDSIVYINADDVTQRSEGTTASPSLIGLRNSTLVWLGNAGTGRSPQGLAARNGQVVGFDLENSILRAQNAQGSNAAPGFNIAGANVATTNLNNLVFEGWWYNSIVDIPLIGVNFANTSQRQQGAQYYVRIGRPADQTATNTAVTSWMANCVMPAAPGTLGLNFFNTNLGLDSDSQVDVFIVDAVLRSDGNLPINYFTTSLLANAPRVRLLQGWRPVFQDGVGVSCC